jgi:hypothetical protein
MADIYATNWNETDASNTDAAPDGMPEGMRPSGVNDWGRAVAGALKRYVNQNIPKTTAGTSTSYTLSYTVAPGALVDGMTHVVNFNATCGASPTLNVNTLGAKPIHYFNGATWAVVPSGRIKSGMTLEVAYNASAGTYRIVSSAAPVMAQSAGSYFVLPAATPMMLQWGVTSASGFGVSNPVTFSPVFSGTPTYLSVTNAGDNGGIPAYPLSLTSGGFDLINPGSLTVLFYWLAIGPA